VLCCGPKYAIPIDEASTEIPVHLIPWKASWISPSKVQDTVNSWTVYRKSQELEKEPSTAVLARIAVDSKYWLWINERLVVFEGGLKRGPNPNDTYYDTIDISPYLKQGTNTIAVLVWYFGKDGFSHNSSGKSGLLFDVQTSDFEIQSDASWEAWVHEAFEETMKPYPNYRLAESNIRFDARKGDFEFIKKSYKSAEHEAARAVGIPPVGPWNKLIKRNIPQWKNSGLKAYENTPVFLLLLLVIP